MFIISIWLHIFIFFYIFLLNTFTSLSAHNNTSKSVLWDILIITTFVFFLFFTKFVIYFNPSVIWFFPVLLAPPHATTSLSLVKLLISSLSVFMITSKPMSHLCNLSPYDSLELLLLLHYMSENMHAYVWLCIYILICLFAYNLPSSLTHCPILMCNIFSMLHVGYSTAHTCNDSM